MGIPEQVELMHALHIKAGRAVLAVLFKGMIEREWTSSRVFPEPGSVRFRALMVRHATELSRGLDYLETRDDIYMGWLAYLGFSWGAASRLVFDFFVRRPNQSQMLQEKNRATVVGSS